MQKEVQAGWSKQCRRSGTRQQSSKPSWTTAKCVKPHRATILQRKNRYIWKLNKESIICHAATRDKYCQKRCKDVQTLVSGTILFLGILEFSRPVSFCSISAPGYPALVAMFGEMFVFTYCIMGKWNKPAIDENKNF